MPVRYQRLVELVRDHADDLVHAALVINAWQWTSLLPEGTRPKKVEEVPTTLIANCGVRDWLFRELFKPLGIRHRRVNFYDVPFQGGHSTTELLLPGRARPRWMWFDPTFGVYACVGSERLPASIAAISAWWPDVTFHSCCLPGWLGSWTDPQLADVDALYRVDRSQFFFFPENFKGVPGVISGERYSLYFGPNVFYYDGPTDTNIAVTRPDWSWQYNLRRDDAGQWKRLQTTYHRDLPITQYGEYEDIEPYQFRFIDFCRKDVDTIEWQVRPDPPGIIAGKRVTDSNGSTIDLDESNVAQDREFDPFLSKSGQLPRLRRRQGEAEVQFPEPLRRRRRRRTHH